MPMISIKYLSLCLVTAALYAAVGAAQTPVRKTLVATGLDRPVWVGAPPGDDTRLFALESRVSRVRVIRFGQGLLAQPFLDVPPVATNSSEQGLLGMAFHPQYASNGYFFVNYTRDSDGATVVARYQVSASNPDVADPASAATVMVVQQPQRNHNGGCMHFGPDGYLYIAFGDGGGGGCRGQDGTLLLGKMLRLDVDGAAPYAIPPTNPFVGQAGVLPEIWHFGLRHPWRFCFDRQGGDMYIADVGWSTREEVSFQPGGSPGGLNFGWGTMEGTVCQLTSCPGPVCNASQLQRPIHEYPNRSTGVGDGCAIIGGHVYRDCPISDLYGRYFFADNCSDRVWSLRYDGQQVVDVREHTAELNPSGQQSLDTISSFGEDSRGRLYVVAMNDGYVWRIEPELGASVTDLGYGEVGGNGRVPELTLCGDLSPGGLAHATLRRAPPQMPALLAYSWQNNPTQFSFGTVVTFPAIATAGAATDASGEARIVLAGVPGPFSIYLQWAVLDPARPSGIGLSNAVRLDLP